ncbi:hypothetical protein [Coralloluteibacterium thermophilus]|uniref:Lipoprotein n=1 Tax=Coralloluteibacterium thermophilum TaxID=2707049 RepID=A0ABV9NEJ9_9GAMM
MPLRTASLAIVLTLLVAACARHDGSLYRQVDGGGPAIPPTTPGADIIEGGIPDPEQTGAPREVRDAQQAEGEDGGLGRRLDQADDDF